MNTEELILHIKENIEWLSTTENDEVECISVENLEGILSKFFNKTIKISQNGN